MLGSVPIPILGPAVGRKHSVQEGRRMPFHRSGSRDETFRRFAISIAGGVTYLFTSWQRENRHSWSDMRRLP
jgi:hypothetical protein